MKEFWVTEQGGTKLCFSLWFRQFSTASPSCWSFFSSHTSLLLWYTGARPIKLVQVFCFCEGTPVAFDMTQMLMRASEGRSCCWCCQHCKGSTCLLREQQAEILLFVEINLLSSYFPCLTYLFFLPEYVHAVHCSQAASASTAIDNKSFGSQPNYIMIYKQWLTIYRHISTSYSLTYYDVRVVGQWQQKEVHTGSFQNVKMILYKRECTIDWDNYAGFFKIWIFSWGRR